MLLSIIIPSYNRHYELHRLLYSIYHTGLNTEVYEVIISDDSDDEDIISKNLELIEYFREWMNIKYVKNKYPRVGPAGNRQNGLDNATGKWIIFADDDDVFVNRTEPFDNIKYLLGNDDNVSCIITKWLTEDSNGNINYVQEDIDFHIKYLTHGKIFSKKFIDKHNITYNVSAPAHEDTYFNFWVRSATMYDDEYNIIELLEDKYIFYQFKINLNSLSRTPDFYNQWIVNDPMWFLSKFDAPLRYATNHDIEVTKNIFSFIKNELCYTVVMYICIHNWGCDSEENIEYYKTFFDKWKNAFHYNIDPKEVSDAAIEVINDNKLLPNLDDVVEYFSIINSLT